MFKNLILLLAETKNIDAKHQDHPLIGQDSGPRECHIESDWLSIYESITEELILIRTGSHSDLFNE